MTKRINTREYIAGYVHILKNYPPKRKLPACLKFMEKSIQVEDDKKLIDILIRWLNDLRQVIGAKRTE